MSHIDSKKIDIHAHAFSFDTDATGCFFSKKIMRSLSFKFMSRLYGIKSSDPPSVKDEKVRKTIEQLVSTLVEIESIVLVALDGNYDSKGDFDIENTHFFVSNDYVKKLATDHEKILYGASVNPNRKDWYEELERVIKDGAVLIKLLPNTQGIDPSDKKYTEFYRALAKNRIPLLVHTGREYALNVIDQRFGDFRKLRLALNEGATVIAAHGGGLAIENFIGGSYKELIGMLKEHPNFYVDTSALFLLNKRRYLYKFAENSGIHNKIIYGSDWPVPSNPNPVFLNRKMMKNIPFPEYIKNMSEKNPIERNYFYTKKLNFSDEIFYNGYRLIKKDRNFEGI